MPTDERYQIWCSAIRAYSKEPFKGFICINHFHEDDLIIQKSRTTLKNNAIPNFFVANGTSVNAMKRTINSTSLAPSVSTICGYRNQNFYGKRRKICGTFDTADSADSADTISEPVPPDQSKNFRVPNSCDNCELLKAEKESLRQDYIELDAKRCVEVADLENEIRKLKMDAEIRKQHMKYLSNKVNRKEKSEESLKNLLRDLKEQNVLPLQAYETLEVCVF